MLVGILFACVVVLAVVLVAVVAVVAELNREMEEIHLIRIQELEEENDKQEGRIKGLEGKVRDHEEEVNQINEARMNSAYTFDQLAGCHRSIVYQLDGMATGLRMPIKAEPVKPIERSGVEYPKVDFTPSLEVLS